MACGHTRHSGSYPGPDDHTHLIKVFINCKLVHTCTLIVGVVRVWFTIFIRGIALFEYCIVAVQCSFCQKSFPYAADWLVNVINFSFT